MNQPTYAYETHSALDLNPTPTLVPIQTEKEIAEAKARIDEQTVQRPSGDGMTFIWVLVVLWLLSPFIGIAIARDKGYPGWQGAIAALILGPFIFLALLASKSNKTCPYCATLIPVKAIRCPRCQKDLPA